MKPSHTPDTTATLPIFLAKRMAVASTSFAVWRPRTTSSRRITLAGLKKCSPITSCGRRVKSRDVIEIQGRGIGGENARPASGTPSSVSNTCRLTSMLSNTASITKSTSRNGS